MKKKSITQTSSTDVKPYILPILLTGEMYRKIRYLISKAVGYDIGNIDIYLQNKLTDPALHSNDYLKFEEPSKFRFMLMFTTCKGVYLLKNIFSSSKIDDGDNDDLYEAANREFLQEARDIDAPEGTEISFAYPDIPENVVIPSDVIIPSSENSEENASIISLFEMNPNENMEELNLDEMKILEMMSYFKANQCERLKDGICDKQHYLIGIGDVVINDKTYSGVHIYLYPDKHYDQVDVPQENIKDDIYLRYQENKHRRKKLPSPESCREDYLEKFNQLLVQFDHKSVEV